jgi:hypothetical protein
MDIAYEDVSMFSAVGLAETYSQYIRYRQIKDNSDAPEVYVRIGPSGTGKSEWLDDKFGTSGYTTAPDNLGRWFDKCACDVVLFDDVETGQVPPFSVWKLLCDRHPFHVPVKGGFIWWKPKVIVVTSNQSPSTWWGELDELNKGAFERPVTSIEEVE